MRIGELSQLTGVSIATIRLYEREGLIGTASRTGGKFREFTSDQECRLDFIKRIRNLGFSLNDVKALLTQSSTIDRDLLEQIRDGIAIRKRDLNQLEDCLSKASIGEIPATELDSAFRLS